MNDYSVIGFTTAVRVGAETWNLKGAMILENFRSSNDASRYGGSAELFSRLTDECVYYCIRR